MSRAIRCRPPFMAGWIPMTVQKDFARFNRYRQEQREMRKRRRGWA